MIILTQHMLARPLSSLIKPNNLSFSILKGKYAPYDIIIIFSDIKPYSLGLS